MNDIKEESDFAPNHKVDSEKNIYMMRDYPRLRFWQTSGRFHVRFPG
jgi:hypothetical protein